MSWLYHTLLVLTCIVSGLHVILRYVKSSEEHMMFLFNISISLWHVSYLLYIPGYSSCYFLLLTDLIYAKVDYFPSPCIVEVRIPPDSIDGSYWATAYVTGLTVKRIVTEQFLLQLKCNTFSELKKKRYLFPHSEFL